MKSSYEKSFVGMFNSVDDMIRETPSPRHRAILLNYRRHGLLEVSQRWDELMAPTMMVEHPVYRMNEGGRSALLDGREQVAAFYQQLQDTGSIVLWPAEQVVAVNDWGFASEALFNHFVPGSMLAEDEIDDPEATYLVKHRLAMVWHYDSDCRLIGEHVYEDGTTREVLKPEPHDVITPEMARELLSPIIENEPV